MATKNLHLATIFYHLVATWRLKDFFNFEPCGEEGEETFCVREDRRYYTQRCNYTAIPKGDQVILGAMSHRECSQPKT